ncbi:AraC family L-rhamnose operon regulatory protein RhaS [Fontibacillus phaseoli]|uniref:AraC family L-rhamnose operon regulatory protein RhaS n=1 Tax=Fontibacillus phaseoli TaxID=1416533 RepID=A0A369B239_9BACL|nr:AraC family transcriptional regulator [Fontibacillus phaseoli]RCX15395.1 AraC family L-rhamnose operon regulatory protein RhaS [Fontibacillus phaseoli]
MDLITMGQLHYPGLIHVMRCDLETMQDGNIGAGSRYRLVLVEEGTGIIELDSQTYRLLAPALFCLNETSTLNISNCARLKTKTVYFNPDIINNRFTFKNLLNPVVLEGSDSQDLWGLNPFLERSPSYNGSIPVDSATSRHIANVLEQIDQILLTQNDIHWPCRSRSYLMELLFFVSRNYKLTYVSPEIPLDTIDNELRPVITYLHTHYREKIKLEQLTQLFHTNKTTLNLKFRTRTGQSVMAYLGNIRMQTAVALLRNTLLPNDEIMTMIGINDDANFIRSFRNYAGCTPTEYRKLHCWMMPRT